MQTFEAKRLTVAVGAAGVVMPAVFFARLAVMSEEFRGKLRLALGQERSQPMHAAATLRELVGWMEANVEPSDSLTAGQGFLSRWASRLEDNATYSGLREALEHGDLRSPIKKPAAVGPPLGVRFPGAVIRRSGHVPD